MHTKLPNASLPYKRLVTLTLLTIPIAVQTFINDSRTWYIFSLNKNEMFIPGSYIKTKNISAYKGFTGYELMSSDMVNTTHGTSAAVNSLAGLPYTTLFVVAGTLVLLMSTLLRLAFLSIISLLLFNASRRSLDITRSLVENPNFGGDYMVPTNVIAQQGFLQIIAIILSILVLIQLLYINKLTKKASNKMSIFEVITNTYSTVLSRFQLTQKSTKEKTI